jgi:hypothetical protein
MRPTTFAHPINNVFTNVMSQNAIVLNFIYLKTFYTCLNQKK